MKKNLITILCIAVSLVLLVLGLRGVPGNPTAETFNNPEWHEQGPLELSPDRGRFALLYSVVEDHSVKFSLPVARFTTPDLAISPSGEYVSLFAPGVSFMLIPGYLVGKIFGVSQVGSFAIVALFAFLNLLLLRAIAIRLGAHPFAAMFGAFAFLFASPAFTYAVTLYQHHFSTFLILSSIYALLRWQGGLPVAYVWFAAALSLSVDYPNFFLMIPLGLWALSRIVWFEKSGESIRFSFFPKYILTFAGAIIPIIFFLWFNFASTGNPFQLAGTLKRVEAINDAGQPTELGAVDKIILPKSSINIDKHKTAVGFFKSRNLFNGFYIHFLSSDRGMITFTPLMILAALGLYYVFKKNSLVANVLIGVAGFDILLYSLWGDPYGGWAFGSRYLIPSYAVFSVGLAFLVHEWRKNYVVLFIIALVFGWSAWINALGAVTSSQNPPQIEVLALEKYSGHEEKYSYDRNEQYLASNHSKSFVFNTVGYQYVSAVNYRLIVAMLIWIMGLALLALLPFTAQKGENI